MNNSYQSIQISEQDIQNMNNYRRNRFNSNDYKENITITHNLGGCLQFYIFIQFVFFVCVIVFLFLKL